MYEYKTVITRRKLSPDDTILYDSEGGSESVDFKFTSKSDMLLDSTYEAFMISIQDKPELETLG